MARISSKNPTMEELLASIPQKPINLSRGQEVEGKVVLITQKEIILDLGTKSEGVIPKQEIPPTQLESMKKGDKMKAYVVVPENESSQVVLAMHPVTDTKGIRGVRLPQNKVLRGRVVEVNRGGLIVEVMGVRGFLPNSQVGFELLGKAGEGMGGLIGQDISVKVIEIDAVNNRLIFSQRGKLEDGVLKRLEAFKNGQKVSARIVCILPFGLVVSAAGVEGMVYVSDASWEKIDDLNLSFKAGQNIDAMILDVDKELGRVNLSIKLLTEDPFVLASQKFSPDEAVKAEVMSVSETGVVFKLEEGVEGFLPSAKMNPEIKYEAGKQITLLVDSVDVRRRKVNLTSLVTSTAGLIYK